MSWIRCEDEMPKSGRRVLFTWVNALGNRRISIGYHAERMSEEAHWHEVNYEGCDYDEDADTYYIPTGWYEIGWEAEVCGDVRDRVTHWMPQPEPPEET